MATVPLEDGEHWPVKGSLNYHAVFVGEGNGTPLQYSCLENPMDGGTW